MTALDLSPISALAPFPKSEDEATPERLAAHFAVLAYMAGRVALTHPDPSIQGQAHRDVGLYWTLAYLTRTLATNAGWAATTAARAIREELEDGTHIAVDLADWLREYKISPDIVDLAARHLVTEATLARADADHLQAEADRLHDALAEALATIDRVTAIRPRSHGCVDGTETVFVRLSDLRDALGLTADGKAVAP